MSFVYEYSKSIENGEDIFYLDIGTVPNDIYDKLKPIIEHLGGHWRQKVRKFVFRENVEDILFECINNGVDITDEYKWRENTQFFPTPKSVAKKVIRLAELSDGLSVLEPSAGTGSLVDEIKNQCDIICIEPLEENKNILINKGYNCIFDTFENFFQNNTLRFDRIVMNPPFAGQKDALHLMSAFELLNKNGILVAIISENALYYETDISNKLRVFLKENNAHVENIPPHSFKESGTTIETVIVKIIKK